MFNFTPLLGAQSASPASQSLLEFDGGVKVLVDVGWDEGFDAEKLKEIEKYVLLVEDSLRSKGGS
jgi:cleavage and polyadenylation specificity factor subunit 2